MENQKILKKANEIIDLLSLNFELTTIQDLSSSKFYFDVFRVLFPYLYVTLEQIENTNVPDENKIQNLIDLLSKDVLTMDLSHIKGDLIVNSDEKGIWHFLEILEEILKMCIQQSDEGEDQSVDYEYISSEVLPEEMTSKEKNMNDFDKKLKTDPNEYSAPWDHDEKIDLKQNLNSESNSENAIDLDEQQSESVRGLKRDKSTKDLIKEESNVDENNNHESQDEQENDDHIFKSTEMQEFKGFLDENIKQLKWRLKKLNMGIPKEISVKQ